jgi:hypothetical protein
MFALGNRLTGVARTGDGAVRAGRIAAGVLRFFTVSAVFQRAPFGISGKVERKGASDAISGARDEGKLIGSIDHRFLSSFAIERILIARASRRLSG